MAPKARKHTAMRSNDNANTSVSWDDESTAHPRHGFNGNVIVPRIERARGPAMQSSSPTPETGRRSHTA
ncbi:hypothetical protein MesoLj131a_58360 [Mesorhizobium sp. 131-2-1]|nr:hypothetical protein MesoLj131a_58360 [Mesorhizobium sp. 131-2-1]